jgi:transposase
VKKYVVNLSEQEEKQLRELTRKGKTGARRLRRAHVLLLADEGRTDEEVASALRTAVRTVERVRKRFVEEGLEAALSERSRMGGALRRKLDGRGEAYLVALACSKPPEEYQRWTMQMLAERLVEVGVVEEISDETVRRTLKKGTSSHT